MGWSRFTRICYRFLNSLISSIFLSGLTGPNAKEGVAVEFCLWVNALPTIPMEQIFGILVSCSGKYPAVSSSMERVLYCFLVPGCSSATYLNMPLLFASTTIMRIDWTSLEMNECIIWSCETRISPLVRAERWQNQQTNNQSQKHKQPNNHQITKQIFAASLALQTEAVFSQSLWLFPVPGLPPLLQVCLAHLGGWR